MAQDNIYTILESFYRAVDEGPEDPGYDADTNVPGRMDSEEDSLANQVIAQIRDEVLDGDFTALEELVSKIAYENPEMLRGYLPEPGMSDEELSDSIDHFQQSVVDEAEPLKGSPEWTKQQTKMKANADYKARQAAQRAPGGEFSQQAGQQIAQNVSSAPAPAPQAPAQKPNLGQTGSNFGQTSVSQNTNAGSGMLGAIQNRVDANRKLAGDT